jgi:chromosomal replication initiation ATPase DnaA
MQHWTETAIARALEGRFYDVTGTCRREKREREEREKEEAAAAVREFKREQAKAAIRRGPMTAPAIIAATAYAHGLGVADLLSNSRRRHIAIARQHACALMREFTGMPFQAIAEAIGLKDHSTAHHGVRQWHAMAHRFPDEARLARQMLGVK